MSQPKLHFLALGDSYTIGESVPSSGCWPVQLTHLLREKCLPFDAPFIIAQTGWTTDELRVGIERSQPDRIFDLVSLQIGVNNQYRERPVEEYRHQFLDLLDLAIAFAGGDRNHVIVLSIPDWSITPFAAGRNRSTIRAAIDQFNTVNRLESENTQVGYVDVTPNSRLAAQDRTLLASDGLHPSEKMYAAWAKLILPVALTALQNESHE